MYSISSDQTCAKWDFEVCILYQLEICMLYYRRPSFKVKHFPISSYRMLNTLWIADGKHVPVCTSTSLNLLVSEVLNTRLFRKPRTTLFSFWYRSRS